MHHSQFAPPLCALSLLVAVFTPGGGAQATSARHAQSTATPTPPLRAAPALTPAPPPDVPAELDAVAPATITLALRRKGDSQGVAVRCVVSRTTDRVHVAVTDGRDWLFERNTADRRRVSGVLIHHATRTIVTYEESDLRNWLGVRGWVDVAALATGSELAIRLPARPPDSPTRVVVEQQRAGVSADALRTARSRFPGYRSVDLAEWLER